MKSTSRFKIKWATLSVPFSGWNPNGYREQRGLSRVQDTDAMHITRQIYGAHWLAELKTVLEKMPDSSVKC